LKPARVRNNKDLTAFCVLLAAFLKSIDSQSLIPTGQKSMLLKQLQLVLITIAPSVYLA